MTQEDGLIRLHMHPGQTAAYDSTRRFVFVLAGTQGGKTSWGPWWLLREIYGDGERRGAGAGDYLAVTSSYDLFKLKMLPALRDVFEHRLALGRWWASDRVLELRPSRERPFRAGSAGDPMWGRVLLRSAASSRGLEAATAKAAWLDECGQDAFTVETWEAVLRRLSLAQGRVLGTTTPYNLGWVKTEIYDRWRAGDQDIGVYSFRSILNPSFPLAEFERARETMPDWRFRMFYCGQFTRPAGLIYEAFDEAVHLRDPFDMPPAWPRYVGVDFGAVNTAVVWLAHDPQRDVFHAYRESLAGGRTTAQHAAEALAHAQTVNVAQWFGGAPGEEQQRMDWAAEGVPVLRPPVADVEAGIDRVARLLRERRLYVWRTCRGLLDELGSYRRKLNESGQTTEEIECKRDYHRLDALRYVVSGILGGDVQTVEGWWR